MEFLEGLTLSFTEPQDSQLHTLLSSYRRTVSILSSTPGAQDANEASVSNPLAANKVQASVPKFTEISADKRGRGDYSWRHEGV
jgi:hypothetical protein